MLKNNVKDDLEKLLRKRKKFYDKAHITFDTSKHSFDEMLKNINKYF